MFFASKRHKEADEDANTLSGTIEAIGSAAVDVVTASATTSALVQSLLEPLRKEIEAVRSEHASCSERLDHLEAITSGFIQYINLLRGQVRQLGAEPLPPPHGVDGHPFE